MASKKPGFTLLELLIVMAIIALLAVLAITSYAGVQRSARIGYAADSLVATIREAQVLARSGARSEGGGLQCTVVKLASGSDSEAGLFSAVSAYKSAEDACENSSQWRKNDFFDENTLLKSLEAVGLNSGLTVGDELELYFKPPFGQVYLMTSGGFTPLTSGILTFVVGAEDKVDFDQMVKYDLATNEVNRFQ
ncbi:prepilin-type N-terminal cleavage/methylation domain-containing protein [Candidatus Peregrinibacteria bacterium]|nr:prepilin-type N-terminal cleavage/methylation domain-containing protein [Candidatus Peregrinibacteria bacterium]